MQAYAVLMHLVQCNALCYHTIPRLQRNPKLWLALWRLGNRRPTPGNLGTRHYNRMQALLAAHPMP